MCNDETLSTCKWFAFDSKDIKVFNSNILLQVILCAGALNTPHILMLSGVGPRDILETYNIPVIADLPVGQNLQNHLGINLFFVLDKIVNARILTWATAMDYFLEKEGIMTSTGITQVC